MVSIHVLFLAETPCTSSVLEYLVDSVFQLLICSLAQHICEKTTEPLLKTNIRFVFGTQSNIYEHFRENN